MISARAQHPVRPPFYLSEFRPPISSPCARNAQGRADEHARAREARRTRPNTLKRRRLDAATPRAGPSWRLDGAEAEAKDHRAVPRGRMSTAAEPRGRLRTASAPPRDRGGTRRSSRPSPSLGRHHERARGGDSDDYSKRRGASSECLAAAKGARAPECRRSIITSSGDVFFTSSSRASFVSPPRLVSHAHRQIVIRRLMRESMTVRGYQKRLGSTVVLFVA